MLKLEDVKVESTDPETPAKFDVRRDDRGNFRITNVGKSDIRLIVNMNFPPGSKFMPTIRPGDWFDYLASH
jgi:hypothetical protein